MAKLDSGVLNAAVLAYTRSMEGAKNAPYQVEAERRKKNQNSSPLASPRLPTSM
jgi:hypothetical protein